jgi:hypothetical protein
MDSHPTTHSTTHPNSSISSIKYWQYIILILIILSAGFIVYKTHLSYTGEYIDPYKQNMYVQGKNIYYPFPFHADEFTHMASGIYILENGRIPDINPYSGEKHMDLEPGFHIFLALLFTVMDPVKSYQFFPAINMMLLMMAIFFFVYVITKNYYIGILSAIFSASLQSNINIQGIWFFLPFTFGLSLMFFFLAAYFSKRYIIAGIIFFATIFVYPIAAIIALGTVLLYELLQGRLKEYWHIGLGILLLIFVTMVSFRKNIPFINFDYGWTPVFEHTYVPWDIYGWSGIIFALIGIFFLFYRKEYKNQTISPMYIIIITLIPMPMYIFFRFSIIIPYQRAFVYFMYGFAIVSGLGLYYSCVYIEKLLKHLEWNKNISKIIIGIVIASVIITSFIGYYEIKDSRFRLPHYISDVDYNALSWINTNYGTNPDTIMMSDIFVSYAVYPIARIKVVAVPASNLETGNIGLVYDFYYRARNCNDMTNAVSKSGAELVYITYPLNCPGFKEVYNKGRYVYEVE